MSELDDRGFIYFLAAPAVDAVKIGTTYRLDCLRLKENDRGSPTPLRLLAARPGGKKTEEKLHERFGAARLHARREWFDLNDPELQTEIAACREEYGLPADRLRISSQLETLLLAEQHRYYRDDWVPPYGPQVGFVIEPEEAK